MSAWPLVGAQQIRVSEIKATHHGHMAMKFQNQNVNSNSHPAGYDTQGGEKKSKKKKKYGKSLWGYGLH